MGVKPVKTKKSRDLEAPVGNRPEDFLNRGIKAAVGALPVVGGPLNEFIAFAIGDPAQERRGAFMQAGYARQRMRPPKRGQRI